jgi:hypothetical protein
MNAKELSEDLKNFQLLELSYFHTAMSAADAIVRDSVRTAVRKVRTVE